MSPSLEKLPAPMDTLAAGSPSCTSHFNDEVILVPVCGKGVLKTAAGPAGGSTRAMAPGALGRLAHLAGRLFVCARLQRSALEQCGRPILQIAGPVTIGG
jgi:hypothetical protein